MLGRCKSDEYDDDEDKVCKEEECDTGKDGDDDVEEKGCSCIARMCEYVVVMEPNAGGDCC